MEPIGEKILNTTVAFLKDIDELSRENIPSEVLLRTAQALQDHLAVAAAGAKFQEEKLRKYLDFAAIENGMSTAVAIGKMPLSEAVFLNGFNAHALDYDDGTNAGIIHLGTPVFALLLPLAERYGKTVGEVLRAAVIGYETSFTAALTIQPMHKALGYHATGTCGALGAALAASYLLGFTEEERFQAFAAACASATGMLSVLDDGSELKPYNAGKAALLALESIRLAKAGFRGNPDPLGSPRGFLRMMSGQEGLSMKPVLYEGTCAVMKAYVKPYASCRYTHPAVEAATHLREKAPLRDVERIDVRTYALAVSGHDHTEIKGSASAKMSIPYALAAGFVYGKAGLQEFSEETVRDEAVLALTRRVHVEADAEMSAAFPKKQSALVTVWLKDGRNVSERVDFPKGEPENPLSEEEFRERFDGLMDYAGQKEADRVYELARRAETPAAEIMALLV